ncbi:TolC family protein [Imhoffiella purpurea]|nr:hypothetical protein [Imhoffiella purpurea]
MHIPARRSHPWLGSIACGLLVWIAQAAWGASTPLSLDEVLKDLAVDSSESLSAGFVAGLPRRQSLYLDCHRLAFAETTPADASRSQPLFAVLAPLAARQLDVMERYFDVLLADQSFAADSEAMAVAYVQFDRARARAELGQFSELRVLELEAIYQKYLHRRTASQIAQQQTRALLAVSLGDIGELPRDLAAPSLPPLPETLPEFDELRAKASAEFERHGALVQAGPARIVRERDQQLMELLLRLELLDAAWRRVGAESARNDLKLDQSRTLYEQEVTADLGYSMSQQTRSRFDEQRIDYCRALAWAEIQALVGEPVWISANEGP